MSKPRILIVEAPETLAIVDFLSEGVSVTLSLKDGKLEISSRHSHGEESSSFDRDYHEWIFPKT